MHYFSFFIFIISCSSITHLVDFREDLWRFSDTDAQYKADMEAANWYMKEFSFEDDKKLHFLGTKHTKDLTTVQENEIFAKITNTISTNSPDCLMIENFAGGLEGVYVDYDSQLAYPITTVEGLSTYDDYKTTFAEVSLNENLYTFHAGIKDKKTVFGWEDLSIRPMMDEANANFTRCTDAYKEENNYDNPSTTGGQKGQIEIDAEESCAGEMESYSLSRDHLLYEKINRILLSHNEVFIVAGYAHLFSLEENLNNLVEQTYVVEESDPPHADAGTVAGYLIGMFFIFWVGMYFLCGHGLMMNRIAQRRKATVEESNLTSANLLQFNKNEVDETYIPPSYKDTPNADEETPEKNVQFVNFEIEDSIEENAAKN